MSEIPRIIEERIMLTKDEQRCLPLIQNLRLALLYWEHKERQVEYELSTMRKSEYIIVFCLITKSSLILLLLLQNLAIVIFCHPVCELLVQPYDSLVRRMLLRGDISYALSFDREFL